MKYTGYLTIQLNDEKLAAFYQNMAVYAELYNLKENQYLLIEDSSGQVVDRYCFQNGELRPVRFNVIENTYCGKLKPRNVQQELAFDMMLDKNTKVKLLQGVYGSGRIFATI